MLRKRYVLKYDATHYEIRQDAFSLVELMVVVAIIGILSTIVTVSVLERSDDAKRARVGADFRALETALKTYKLDNGRYPNSLNQLLKVENRKGPWLDKLPNDPWDNAYEYELKGGGTFILTSYGADKQPGGEGLDEDRQYSNRELR